jgi:hypothetical protein
MRTFAVVGLLLGGALWCIPAEAATCQGSGGTGDDLIEVVIECEVPASESPAGSGGSSSQPSPYLEYKWTSICADSPTDGPTDAECVGATTCADPDERLWQLWGRLPREGWVGIRTQCIGGVPPAYVPPTVTPGDVLSALRRIGLPRLDVEVQPADKTLVNFDTIFWTDPETVALGLTILGQGVDVVATPVRYAWSFGDGTGRTTSTPGDPYPSRSITHRYQDAEVTVHPQVAVAYRARFRVDGGGWQQIDETVSTTGPATSLRVAEATPLLSGGGTGSG